MCSFGSICSDMFQFQAFPCCFSLEEVSFEVPFPFSSNELESLMSDTVPFPN